jgi:hypothetical protein
MLKRFLTLLPLLLITGCASTFTGLTPSEQPRNANNLYPVEVVFDSSQQSLRWDSIHPYVLVNGALLPMRQVLGMANRWEGLVPVPATDDMVTYRFKFDYDHNVFGSVPKPDSTYSPVYTLKIMSP